MIQLAVNPGVGQGELLNNLYFSIWMDDNCDNIFQENEGPYLVQDAPATNLKYAIADSQHGSGPIQDACIGVAWSVPDIVGNIIQGDSVTGDITFNAYQARHNDGFLCNEPENYCGDGDIDEGEQCELPGETNCPYCTQSTTQCIDTKTQTRDGYGDCGESCGCVYDPWSDPVCIKDSCGAACAVDADCDDGDIHTTDTCNLSACGCEHSYVPYCGDGHIDQGEQCDDGNTNNDDGCSSACQSEPAYIVIHKDVVNNGVGTKSSSDFGMTLDDVLTAQDTQINVGNTNVHVVSEQNTMDYIKTYSGDCDGNGNITAAYNQTKTCTVTNTMPYATLTVVKEMINDDGGNNGIGDFQLYVSGIPVTSGVSKNFAAGSYVVSETGVSGYAASFSDDCDQDGNVSLVAGDNKTCTLTNNDIKPNITLIKSVINDSGGTAGPFDFSMRIDGVLVPSGTSRLVTANAAHTINEDAKAGYHFHSITGSPECPAVLGETATLNEGQAITCTITNDDN